MADEALVDERLQGIERGFPHLLGRPERTSAREDGAGEELLLLLGKQVEAPLDGGPKRLLARIGVAAAFEQVETLGEALEDLGGREHARARGASSTARSESRRRQSSPIASSGASRERVLKARPPLPLRGRHRELHLALYAKELATRHEQAEAGARREARQGGRCLDHLLEVVEQKQQLALADVLGEVVLRPRVWATVSATRAGSRRAASPTQNTPALYSGTSSAAASIASLVLPEPPGPSA